MEEVEEAGCTGGAHEHGKAAPPRVDAAELEQLQQEQRERRRRNDMLSRLELAAQRPRQHFSEHRLEGAARLAATHLRKRVTLLADVEAQDNCQAMIDSAVRLPCVFCAFSQCNYTIHGDDEELRDHHWRESEIKD